MLQKNLGQILLQFVICDLVSPPGPENRLIKIESDQKKNWTVIQTNIFTIFAEIA